MDLDSEMYSDLDSENWSPSPLVAKVSEDMGFGSSGCCM